MPAIKKIRRPRIVSPLPEATDRQSCANCWRQTAELQHASLLATASWLARVSQTPPEEPAVSENDFPELKLCRAVPDCNGLQCEAPVRRDPAIRSTATARLSDLFIPAVTFDSRVHQTLLAESLRHALQTAHIPEGTPPQLGPVSVHALLVANNIASRVRPNAEHAPGVIQGSVSLASEPSITSMEQLLHPSLPFSTPQQEAETPPPIPNGWTWPRTSRLLTPSGTDLLAVEFLRSALDRLKREKLEPVQALPSQQRKRWLGWWAKILQWIALRFTKPKAHRNKRNGLRDVLQLNADDLTLCKRFDDCDLMSAARNGFYNTPLSQPERAALFLKNLRAAPDADLVLPRLCQSLVAAHLNSGSTAWFASLCANLLDNDPSNFGGDVASFLLLEFISQARGENGRNDMETSPLWAVLSGSSFAEDEQVALDAVDVITRLCRRASALQSNERASTRPERKTVGRMQQVVSLLWAHPPLASKEWQRLLLRCLEQFLAADTFQEQIPSGTGCRVSTLATIALQISNALAQQDGETDLPLKELATRVCAHPLFPFWNRETPETSQNEATLPSTWDAFIFGKIGLCPMLESHSSAYEEEPPPVEIHPQNSYPTPQAARPTQSHSPESRSETGQGSVIARPSGKGRIRKSKKK